MPKGIRGKTLRDVVILQILAEMVVKDDIKCLEHDCVVDRK